MNCNGVNTRGTSYRPAVEGSPSWLLWAGFILVSLNLRLIFATVGPLLKSLELGFVSTLLVTTLPLLLLGVFSMPGVKLRQRWGEERALFAALMVLVLGCAVRAFGESGLILGTVLGSAGVAVMNVIMPALARKRFGPQRMGMVMGIYALMLGVGAVLGASASFPLAHAIGADRVSAFRSLGMWAIPALLALLFLLPQLRYAAPAVSGKGASAESAPRAVNVYRNGTAWSITLFFGLHVLNLYVFLPWMPSILMDRGMVSGTAAITFSLSQFGLMVASFVAPWLAHRCQDQRLHIASIVLLCLAGTLGLAYAPVETAMLWALLLGVGQGAGIALATFLFIAKSASIDTAAHVSAMAQTVGYLIAVAGPLLVGAIHHRAGNWNAALAMVAGLLLIELVVALPAGRDVKV